MLPPNAGLVGQRVRLRPLEQGDAPVLIGNIVLRGLSAEHRHAEVGIAIGDGESRGRGYGEDAMRTLCRYGFDDLDLHRIELTTLSYNLRAVRSYEKVGFVLEGRRREHRYKGGRYWDLLHMGLLRSDFRTAEVK